MSLLAIYAKTAKGLRQRKSLFGGLSSQLMSVLTLVDGSVSAGEIRDMLGNISEEKLLATLKHLEHEGYIKYLTESVGEEEWEFGTVFTPMVVEEVADEALPPIDEEQAEIDKEIYRLQDERRTREIEAQIREKEKAKAAAEQQAKQEAQRIAQEEAEKQKAAQLARETAEKKRIQLELEEKARIEAQQQAAEEARLAAEQEAQARAKLDAEAKEKARLEAERVAKEAEENRIRAEEDARIKAAEIKAKQEAEARVRLEGERLAQEAEARQQKAQEQLRKAEQEAQALVEKIRTKEKARREQVRLEKQAEAERKKAEAEAKAIEEARLAAEMQAKQEAEALAKAEMEAKAIAEAKERGRLEAERILRAQEEAQRQAEAAAQAKVEEEARIAAQMQAQQEAQARAELEAQAKVAEENARLEAERILRAQEEAQRQAEAAAQAKAEEEARIAAQMQAQQEAQALALAKEQEKIDKARIAQEKAEEKARVKAEEKARKEAERIAKKEREEALEAEKKAQKLAEKQAKEEAEQLSLESGFGYADEDQANGSEDILDWKLLQAQQKRKSARKSIRLPAFFTPSQVKNGLAKCAKLSFIYLPILAIVLLVFMHFMPLGMLVKPIENIASSNTGESVKIASVHAALWPQPHFTLKNVTVGDKLNAESVQVFPVITTLFDENKVVKSMTIEGMDLDQAFFGTPLQWLNHAGKATQLKVDAYHFKKVKLHIRDFELGTFDGDVRLNAAREFASIEMQDAQQGISAEIKPQGVDYYVLLSSSKWALPMRNKLVFEALQARGIYQQNKLHLNQVSGEIYGGKFDANVVLDWSDAWLVDGDFKLTKVNTDALLENYASTASVVGKLTLSGNFSSRTEAIATLMDGAIVSADFEVQNGKINGIDMPQAIVRPNDKSLEGYNTGFDRLSGSVQIKEGQFQYRNLVLKSPKMQAQGQLNIDAEQNISGKVNANLATPTRNFQEVFNLTGQVANVKRK